MATEDPASVPALASEATEDDYGVSGVPKSGRSAIDLAAAIGAACNTPQPTTSLNEEETETSDPTRSDPEAVRAPNPDDSGPDLLSDEPSATPANTEESARGQQVEEAASVVNGDIDLCRRAVLLQPQEEDVCSICLDEFTEEDPGQATACGHLYHLQCVMQWAQRSRECPLCFRALQLQDEEVNSLLPFGEYIAPPGPGATNPTSVSALAQHMYGVESWELEQLLQRLALSSQQTRSHHHSSGHRRHHRSRRHRENTERTAAGDQAPMEGGEARQAARESENHEPAHRHRSSSRNHHGGSSRSASAVTSGEAAADIRGTNSFNTGTGSSRDSAAAAEGRYPRRSAEPQRHRAEAGESGSRSYHRRRHSDVHSRNADNQSPTAASSSEAISSTFDLKAASVMLKNRWNAMGLKCREVGRATRALWRGTGGADPGSGASTSRD